MTAIGDDLTLDRQNAGFLERTVDQGGGVGPVRRFAPGFS